MHDARKRAHIYVIYTTSSIMKHIMFGFMCNNLQWNVNSLLIDYKVLKLILY